MNPIITQPHRDKISQGLMCVLSDTYVLYLKTQNYHWNVTGPHFVPLHGFFQDQYESLAEAVDTLAERMRALGSPCRASFSNFLKNTALKEEMGTPDATQMLRNLYEDHVAVVQTLNAVFKEAEESNDQVTMDLIVDRLTFHEKTLWMIKSQL